VAPMFERDLEQPLAGAIPVLPGAGLVVTEGNYLLLDEPRWHAVRAELDAVWHVRTDDTLRMERLVARHVAFGKEPGFARAWVERVDVPNSELVEAAADRADVVVDVTRLEPGKVLRAAAR
jgi:pantothenate kinase